MAPPKPQSACAAERGWGLLARMRGGTARRHGGGVLRRGWWRGAASPAAPRRGVLRGAPGAAGEPPPPTGRVEGGPGRVGLVTMSVRGAVHVGLDTMEGVHARGAGHGGLCMGGWTQCVEVSIHDGGGIDGGEGGPGKPLPARRWGAPAWPHAPPGDRSRGRRERARACSWAPAGV